MAIWQFEIDFFPILGLTSELGDSFERVPEEYLPNNIGSETDLDNYDDPSITFWKNYCREDFALLMVEIASKLPEVEWLINSNDVFSWGNSDTNDITICFLEDCRVEFFGARINLSNIDENFIDFVLDICISQKFLIADKKGNLIPPDRFKLGKLIANSNQANFVADPEKFINDISIGKRKPK